MKRYRKYLLVGALMSLTSQAHAEWFWTGDANGDGQVTVADVTVLKDYLLKGDSLASYKNGADVNQDGKITLRDLTLLIEILNKRSDSQYIYDAEDVIPTGPKTDTFDVRPQRNL